MMTQAMAIAHDDTIPDAAAPATWFEATTPAGPIRLRITAPVRHAADAAIALGRAEPLTRAIEDWTGEPLDWRLLTATNARPASASHTFARTEIGLIEWPWALLRVLPAPPESLATQLRWPSAPAVLTIARLGLAAAELAMIEAGGAVLIPESLEPAWRGSLRAIDEPAHDGVAVAITGLRAATVLAERAVALEVPGDRTACEVRLDLAAAVPCDRLVGWSEAPLGPLGARASLWRQATNGEPARCVAIGTLMPWGQGAALAIETVCDPAGVVV